jgi:hypothetical protein
MLPADLMKGSSRQVGDEIADASGHGTKVP